MRKKANRKRIYFLFAFCKNIKGHTGLLEKTGYSNKKTERVRGVTNDEQKDRKSFLYVEVSDRGAELMRIMRKDTGAEILWNGDPAFWSYRSPILFPNVGSTWQKKMKINGKEYQTRQHGFAREKEFTCVEESTEKLRYRLMSDEETRKYYPFDFVLWIIYELREKEVLVSWEVENRSGEVMSFTIGGHPGFRFEKEGEQKEDYELYFPEIQSLPLPQSIWSTVPENRIRNTG